jgi:two-component system chemotaxis response regulator CheY
MQRTDFSQHRVLLVGAKTHPLRLMRSVMGIAEVGKVIHVEEGRRALELLSMEHFSAVFCDDRLEKVGDKPFVLAARRHDAMLNPMIPIFVFRERARRRDVEAARDYGVTDVLTIPISPKTLVTKLQLATHSPRAFIVATEFFGPDRRTKARPSFFGSDRRKRIAKKAKMDLTHI